MDINAIITEYWPVAAGCLAGVALIVRAIAKKTKNTVDDKVADVLEDVVNFTDGQGED